MNLRFLARLTKVDYPVCAFLPRLNIKSYFSTAGGIEAVLYQFTVALKTGGCNSRQEGLGKKVKRRGQWIMSSAGNGNRRRFVGQEQSRQDGLNY
ncbi:hypothetical protein ES703_43599 [subsurface metagenome]